MYSCRWPSSLLFFLILMNFVCLFFWILSHCVFLFCFYLFDFFSVLDGLFSYFFSLSASCYFCTSTGLLRRLLLCLFVFLLARGEKRSFKEIVLLSLFFFFAPHIFIFTQLFYLCLFIVVTTSFSCLHPFCLFIFSFFLFPRLTFETSLSLYLPTSRSVEEGKERGRRSRTWNWVSLSLLYYSLLLLWGGGDRVLQPS